MKACDRVNILVVDDVPEKAAAIEDTLLKLDQNVVKAYSGRDALRALTETGFCRDSARRGHAGDGWLCDRGLDP